MHDFGGLSEMTLDDNDDDCSSDLVECAVFTQKDLAAVALPVMEDIRRCGRLCDVTIKVRKQATSQGISTTTRGNPIWAISSWSVL